jgi:tRNA-guanine transglycosylase (EC 2.4.2.29)
MTMITNSSSVPLVDIGFDGYALGGLSVGEPPEQMQAFVQTFAPELPEERPRYLMGVGTPADLVRAVAAGVDQFDCVLPTRGSSRVDLQACKLGTGRRFTTS